jgi:segregation and condensation protein A
MGDYRVNLDIYNGPLDLLLYLIRREEVDIYDIPISRITGQFVEHVEVLQGIDPNLAGDFLVMAATLMEIKTRMLLPTPVVDGEADEGELPLVSKQ